MVVVDGDGGGCGIVGGDDDDGGGCGDVGCGNVGGSDSCDGGGNFYRWW